MVARNSTNEWLQEQMTTRLAIENLTGGLRTKKVVKLMDLPAARWTARKHSASGYFKRIRWIKTLLCRFSNRQRQRDLLPYKWKTNGKLWRRAEEKSGGKRTVLSKRAMERFLARCALKEPMSCVKVLQRCLELGAIFGQILNLCFLLWH